MRACVCERERGREKEGGREGGERVYEREWVCMRGALV